MNYQVHWWCKQKHDDTKLTLGTDFGTIGFFVRRIIYCLHGVALGAGFDYVPASGTGGAFQTGYDVSSYSNIQYHTPAGMLPFGGSVKIGYVPDMNDTGQLSAKENNSNPATQSKGRNLTHLQVSASPIDGLSIKGDVAQTSNETGVSGNNGTEEGIAANLGGKYTMGPVTVGYVEGGYQPAVASGELTYYENKFIGVQFDVNDSYHYLTMLMNLTK